MIPEELAHILDIMEDLTGVRHGTARKLDEIPATLWEGFVNDIREEFGLPELLIGTDWTADELYQNIVEEKGKEADELPEYTLVIHVDEMGVNDLLDDLEAVLEKHNMPYGIAAYLPKDGKMERTSLRRSSDDGIFRYHQKVMGMFER